MTLLPFSQNHPPGCPGWKPGHDPCPPLWSIHEAARSPSALPSPPPSPWLLVRQAAASPLAWHSCLLLTNPHGDPRFLAETKAMSHCYTTQNPSEGLCHLSIRPKLPPGPVCPYGLVSSPVPLCYRYSSLSPGPPCLCRHCSLCLECPSPSLLL